jgi:hypothetical protein
MRTAIDATVGAAIGAIGAANHTAVDKAVDAANHTEVGAAVDQAVDGLMVKQLTRRTVQQLV